MGHVFWQFERRTGVREIEAILGVQHLDCFGIPGDMNINMHEVEEKTYALLQLSNMAIILDSFRSAGVGMALTFAVLLLARGVHPAWVLLQVQGRGCIRS